ncbi:MAG: tetraacyldisaccharide 4'-kinase [Planctomycetota bacterium]
MSASASAAGANGGIPPAQPHWYAPGSSVQVNELVRRVFGPDLSDHEYLAGGLHLGVKGLAGLFGTLVAGRDFLYTHGMLRPFKAPLPVISVGNLTTGGSGKTPFVAMLAGWLRRHGRRPAVVARGYGAAKVGRPNDEMMELDWILNRIPARPIPPDATAVERATFEAARQARAAWAIPMVASPARRYGAILARQMGADLVILDDGLQHRQIARDLDIVLMDAREPLGPGSNSEGVGPLEGGAYLPLGFMREGLWALERAGAVVIARASLATPLWLSRLVHDLRLRVPDVPIVLAEHRPADLLPHPSLTGKKRQPPDALQGRRVGAFCGIANPEGFGRTLRKLGARMRLSQSFADHHLYTPEELSELAAYARRRDCEVLVTTVKDLTKIPHWKADDVPLYALRVRMDITQGRDELDAAVLRAVERKKAAHHE